MMETCPECGSNEIIPELLVFADEALIGQHPPYVKLQEPIPEKTPSSGALNQWRAAFGRLSAALVALPGSTANSMQSCSNAIKRVTPACNTI